MKKIVYYGLAAWLVGAAASCQKDADATPGDCAAAGKIVKTVTAAAGTVFFNTALQQYVIALPEPGTIDVVDYGVVCGTLPSALLPPGTKVRVSGTLREFNSQPVAPAGATFYYFEPTQVAPL